MQFFYDREHKIYFAITLTLVIALLAPILFSSSDFIYKYDESAQQEASLKQKEKEQVAAELAYEQIIAATKLNAEASQKLFKELISEEEVRKEVEAELAVNQPIVLPQINDTDLKISGNTGKQLVTDYFTTIGSRIYDFNLRGLPTSKAIFTDAQDPSQVAATIADTSSMLNELYTTTVPREALSFHKASIVTLTAYRDLLGAADGYYRSPESKPWPEVYKQYAISNQAAANLESSFGELNNRYQLAETHPQLVSFFSDASPPVNSNWNPFAIKRAHAQIGVGGTIIIGNVPQAILEGIKIALVSAYAKFMSIFLEKLISNLDTYFTIANTLYYTEDLAEGKFFFDYLDKHLTSKDAQVVTQFLPKFSCGGNDPSESIRKILQLEARENAKKYEVSDLNDPDYYSKQANQANNLNDPLNLFFDRLGQYNTALTTARQSAILSQISPGLKNSYESVSRAAGAKIKSSLAKIQSTQQAALNSIFNLGNSNATTVAGQIVGGILTNLFNNFLFSGASVLQESNEVCLDSAVFTGVVPITDVNYQYQGPDPNNTGK